MSETMNNFKMIQMDSTGWMGRIRAQAVERVGVNVWVWQVHEFEFETCANDAYH